MNPERYTARVNASWRWLIALLGIGLMIQIPSNTMVEHTDLSERLIQWRWLWAVGLVGTTFGFIANMLSLIEMGRGNPHKMVAMIKRDRVLMLRLIVLASGTLGVIVALLLGHQLERCLKIGAVLAGGTLACAFIGQWSKPPSTQ